MVGILLRKGTNSKPIVGSAAAVHNPTVSAKATKDVTVTVKESCRITKTLNDVLDRCPSYQEMTPMPKIMTTKLYDYQPWGLCWLLWRETESPKGDCGCDFNASNYPNQSYFVGGSLADDMGLGKTLSMISLIAYQKENQPILPSDSDIHDPNGGTLIICPSGVLGNLILY
jgi:transcription termination factor 2